MNNVELLVLIKGRPITQYHHQGKVFVEGRAGSEYEIELRNHTNGRVEVVLSVDGLSVIDGKSAGTQSSGYLLNAHENIRVPGWILNNEQVAKFAFADKERGYSTQMSDGDPSNSGVIGMMAFAEKIHYVPSPYYYVPYYQSFYQNNYNDANNTSNDFISTSSSWNANMDMSRAPAKSFMSANSSLGGGLTESLSRKPTRGYREIKTSGGIQEILETGIEQSLGTAFGESAQFRTTKVSFERADMIAMTEIFYDEARGLRARGIEISKPSRKRHLKIPKAFPALQEGCQPPPGWKG